MPLYKVDITVACYGHKYVQADSPEQAAEIIQNELNEADNPLKVGVYSDHDPIADFAEEVDNEGNYVPVV